MALELCFFGASPTPQLLISATVVACSVYLYNRATPAAGPAGPPSPAKGDGAAAAGGDAGGGEKQPLLSGGAEEEEVELPPLPPILPMLIRSEHGYSIRRSQ